MDRPIDWFVDIAQVPLTRSGHSIASVSQTPWLDSLLVTAYIGAFSALTFTASSVADRFRPTQHEAEERRSFFRRKLDIVGGPAIFAFRIAQSLSTSALFGICCAQLVAFLNAQDETSAHGVNWPLVFQIASVALYAYLVLLTFLGAFGTTSTGFRAYTHGSWVLACAWGVYAYRDLWPLATVDLSPADSAEGTLMWVKIALLSIAGIFFEPRNPKDDLVASPEQVASAWSLLTYGFMSPIVWTAYRMPHLPFDLLPQLSDFDHLRNLIPNSFPVLDPMRSKSRLPLALKLIPVELTHLAAMSITAVVFAFAAPISINNLLIYLETGSKGNFAVEPWFWIVLLFFGRVFKVISDEWFVYKTTRVNVRMQAIVTELVFEHALRIRMKAETSDNATADDSNAPTAVATPDNASQADVDASSTDDADTETGTHSAESSTATAVSPSPQRQDKDKGKGKEEPAKKEEPKKEKGKNLVGRINNLVSSDLSSLDFSSMHLVFSAGGTFSLDFNLLDLTYIGCSAWVGFAAMILTLPIPGYITKYLSTTQREKMQRTDGRVQLVSEMMNVIRMIKLFGWESRILSQIKEKRDEELVVIRRNKLLGVLNNLYNYFVPILIMLVTFFTYSVIMKESLTAAKVFSAMSVFDMLRMDIAATFYIIPALIQTHVAIGRIADFLYNTELIDEFTEAANPETALVPAPIPDSHKDSVGIRHASFTWANDSAQQASVTPGGTRRRAFALRVDDEVFFRRGKINLVVGPTGSGKTSLLMALLGEMHYLPQGPDSFVSLPRTGGVAYAAQESWVQSDTIRNNIIFGAPFDEARYNKVISQCALKRDLSLFDAGDQTEVGEKGITLSGGQKARITLARAVYSNADILLLDDILAALDVHTSRWIVEKCLKGDILRGRTIVLVTHNVAMVSPIADFVVDMGADGRIVSQGSLSTALAHDTKLLKELKQDEEEMKKASQELDAEEDEDEDQEAKKDAGKLVVEEETELGHVGWDALKLFIMNMSSTPVLFWAVYIGLYIVRHALNNFQTWYLGYWAAQYEVMPAEDVDVSYYLGMYSVTVLIGMIMSAFCIIYYVFGTIRAGRIIHEKLVVSVMGTTLRWLDKTPTSRIIARCTEDIQAVDNRVAMTTEFVVQIGVFMILKMVSVVIFSPIFLGPSLAVAFLGYNIGSIFMKAQLSVKREMSKVKAPVLGHFGAAITGITSIRAYGKQEDFKMESQRRIDRFSRASITQFNLNRWVSMRVDFVGTLYSTALTTYLAYIAHISASNAGFSLNMAAAFSGVILQFVRVVNEWQVSSNSLERIQQYLNVEQEPKPTPEGVPPAYWPASGSLHVEKLCARYSETGPRVLHEVSFEVKSGERVGIVGRTGSGKSSLTLALLRCILTEGHVRYDGLETHNVNLDALRSSITIIPQVPELLSGTLRQNLDPFSEHDDAVLNDALRSAGLFSLQDEGDHSRITLDSEIAGGGANLSVGQRQILALARAIVRRSKLLILDEATSAIDYETDTVIQGSLRTELGKDVTLLTVAHRLQTIMDSDKIMVLDAGNIVEFGSPAELLKNEKGMLRSLVDESGDREKLYAMAMGVAKA
ncbi:P-loop containing nucleoside triphosphate hydrolase protein [Epithele typhae]|uniref:P-loop containing nucleoside triphosphate hydrolase protein n=1 Tax=Epithele typhae TaxID=378194 RepID=UPI002008706A|nr:P-loop containing nucleoside triphosphate hydrolase protein [Epithele typhae]KAH9911177.1 P-loop containing nucleoside triphosphate hydrolase protein [Epithele typhae]